MEIVELERLQLVGLPVRAEWRELWTEMPKAWKKLFEQVAQINHRHSDRFVDTSLEVENGVYLQLVGSEVLEVDRVPEGMMAVDVPAQRYIYHRHDGPTAGIANSFGQIYDWAKANGYNAAEFKLDIGYSANGNETSHELYVAIQPARGWQRINDR
ncbi:GyrI-like domain-containing protein [Saccharospirillum salsuginis]|uniref:AraC effector-binding domain-containing protein n=1 Tax=Saccharospirillum salsuginis TaxID=418750 RepID=A0A918K1K3_9GAMM|nr:effector binding domain-containing protein [Saccharospirillum salsuginis]GGX40023.1 hypothetical protein GCM10007392_03260 [Saccharospirillum salsuginis]